MSKTITRRIALSTFVLVSFCLAGCLGGRQPEPRRWTISACKIEEAPLAIDQKWDVVRVAHLEVAAPYDGLRIAVKRKDGTLAFDARNVFAATPAALLRVPTRDVLLASGKCRAVVPPNSPVRAPCSLEISVDTLALDCSKEGECRAEVALSVTLFEGRELKRTLKSAAHVPVNKENKNLSAAFSLAYSTALNKVFNELAK